jgi:ferredoxin
MESLKTYLSSPFVPKLVCGAGNEDAPEVESLVRLYALAGFKYFDVCAKSGIVEAAQRGLVLARAQGYINVSVGITGDPHADKASISLEKCVACGACTSTCPNGAIDNLVVNATKCIGCSRCKAVCPVNAISTYTTAIPVNKVIPPLVSDYDISSVELHMVGDKVEGAIQWMDLNKCFDGILSLCIDRSIYSDRDLIDRIKWCIKDREPYTTIIQADGCPMSGDSMEGTTLQAVSIAQIVDRAKLPVHLMVSGGTNQYTRSSLARNQVNYRGIAYGTYARNLVKDFIKLPDIFSNKDCLDRVLSDIKEMCSEDN